MKLKKMTSILLLFCLLLGLLSACGKQEVVSPEPSASAEPAAASKTVALQFASSYDEVRDALGEAQALRDAQNSAYASINGGDGAWMEAAADTAAGEGDGAPEGTYYSMTNVQVTGVDEGDTVKTDGEYLYILRDYEMIIMKADNGDVSEISHTIIGEEWESGETEDGSYHSAQKQPTVLYITGDRAVILSDKYRWDEDANGEYSNENYVAVDILDITDRSAPKVVKTLGQDGYLIDSRMIDDKLFVATAFYVWDADEDGKDFVPCLYTNGEAQRVDCGTIGILPGSSSTTYSVLTSYDTSAAGVITTQSILGGGSMLYMNEKNLYLADSAFTDTVTEETEEAPYTVTTHVSAAETTLHRFAVSDGSLTYAATGTVPGTLNNQFSMDEKDGNLRLVATDQSQTYRIYVDEAHDFHNYESDDNASSTGVYVLDEDLNPVGSSTGIAEGEFVYSVRFDGDWCYLCTYKTVDPIFAVDLSDPKKPTVTGAVELPGYSDYLHLWTENELFGLGMQTQEITDEDGGTIATTDGMKLVMIDTSDPAKLKELSTLEIDADYSQALYNHKAILVDQGRNLIAFPAEGSYLIYSFSEESGFSQKKEIAVSEWDWDCRGVYIGDWFYVVGNDRVDVIDLNTLENTDQVILSRG